MKASKERQERQQGHSDGITGRDARWPDSPVYMAAYRIGAAEREKGDTGE